MYLLAAVASHDLYHTDQLLCRFQVLDQALKAGFSESAGLGARCCSCLQDVYGPVMRQSSFGDGNILSPCLSTSCYWNNWWTVAYLINQVTSSWTLLFVKSCSLVYLSVWVPCVWICFSVVLISLIKGCSTYRAVAVQLRQKKLSPHILVHHHVHHDTDSCR